MPYFIKIKFEKNNLSKVTSKGYFISRRKNIVTIRFGSIKVSNKRSKKFRWAGPNLGNPTYYEFKSTTLAKQFMLEKLQLRKRRKYDKLASPVRIYKWEE